MARQGRGPSHRAGTRPETTHDDGGIEMSRRLIAVSMLLMLPGCGVLERLGLIGPKETGSSKLIPFQSEKELTDYIRSQVQERGAALRTFDTAVEPSVSVLENRNGAAPVMADAGTSGASASEPAAPPADFSQTTIQEAGVDEADVVKTDGTYVYAIRNTATEARLTIARIFPPDQLALMGEMSLEGYGRELYLHDGKVIALSEQSGGFFIQVEAPAVEGGGMMGESMMGDSAGTADEPPSTQEGSAGVAAGETLEIAVIDPSVMPPDTRFERPRTIVTIIDVQDPTAPAMLSQTTFDGVVSSSRLIDGVLHLVLSNHQVFYFDVFPMLGMPGMDVGDIQAEDVLPRYTRVEPDGSSTEGPVLTFDELYRPTDPDGFGVVTVVSMDIDAGGTFSAVGVVAEPGLIYSSLDAMYLTDTQYDFSGRTRETTDLYKFAYVDRGSMPVATGTVPGRILDQYSMSEYQGYMRVATTVGPQFSIFGGPASPSRNNVYVLRHDGDTLTVVGQVEDIAPGETIQSARFVGDRGFLVTFEQIDPFFTLDLSDPANPQVVGKLKVPGFSTFILPMDEDHLLTVGRYIPENGGFPWGVQLSIFDVSDFAHPVQTSNVILGQDSGAWSEALTNPKALTYFPQRGLVAIPLQLQNAFILEIPDDFTPIDSAQTAPPDDGVTTGGSPSDGTDQPDGTDVFPPTSQPFDGLVVFRVDASEGLSELGRIEGGFPEAGITWSAYTRGVFVEDVVYAVTDHGVHGADIADVNDPLYELFFGE
ncbi:MAG: hypothetical protein D6788_10685 [Planctomycetota bacterium]|nr:MAG: hypothetical protein D6788_10685 [Planctomycetota bacterium]